MATMQLTFASGESSLDVRRFSVHEGLGVPFTAAVWARSPDHSLDLEGLIGQPASFQVETGYAHTHGNTRVWSGVVRYAQLGRVEAAGLSTYLVHIVPKLTLLDYRSNYRVYQHLNVPDIVDQLLGEWQITATWRLDRGSYPKLEYKTQYGETDYDFVRRLLEEAGITISFDDRGGGEAKLILGDRLHQAEARTGGAIPFTDTPGRSSEREFVTAVEMGHEVRPGAMVIRDHDFRRPALDLLGQANQNAVEARLEQFRYQPGAFKIAEGAPDNTPAADDRGAVRHSEDFGQGRTARDLHAVRNGRRAVRFESNVIDLRPATVFSMHGHPHPAVNGQRLLVKGFTVSGSAGGTWTMNGEAVFTDMPYVPPPSTPRPHVYGVQTATVVGPAGDEIHTDEFGRVRVQFPWDRLGKNDETSSCWVRVNKPWGGRGYGRIEIPRIGQEVLVSFYEGDPDQPVIQGRIFNQTQPVPYGLPAKKTVTSWKSNSSPNADGYNEIKHDDEASQEFFYVQAQKNLRALTKNDETHTTGTDRHKAVGVNETCTTDNDRQEVTANDRMETTQRNRVVSIGGDRGKLIQGVESSVTAQARTALVGMSRDLVTKGDKKEATVGARHLHVKGDRSQKIDGKQSLTVGGDQQEKVGGNHAVQSLGQMYFGGGTQIVGEAPDVTIKTPGGFIRLNGSGITIVGTMVDINVSGSPGVGLGSSPSAYSPAKEASVTPPPPPSPPPPDQG
jgi:type VI secretion system secreted protein VgrG